MAGAYHFLKGYFTVLATGNHTERFFNLAVANRIYLWNVKPQSQHTTKFCVSTRGFSLLEEFAQKTETDLKITEKNGFPVLWKTTKKRRVFVISALVCVVAIFVSSSFIWSVELNDTFVDPNRIKAQLSSYGLGVGCLRKTVDFTEISNRLINDFDEILWANVELKGTKLKVTLIPRTPAPPIIPKEIPTNIVAKKDGFIKEIIAENGEAMVRAGDTVVKDQILISGLIPSPTVGSRYLHSMGTVRAVTWEERSMEQKLYRYDKVFTGNEKTHRELLFPFGKIPLDFLQSIDFYNYDSIIKERHFLFLSYRETLYQEYFPQKTPLTEDEAVTLALNSLLSESERAGDGGEISWQSEYLKKDEETITVTVLVEREEELGVPREITKPEDVR